ncbi:PREDICTED: QWRF motif-containing protein 8-like [Erythranthe guttata]|uniref:QWRF motif-containing protein 8-like n=1 Tax=Erythranthe guttata TaxID=4155 RepID=UPI00064D74FC|nr:PREDICTED: QWRF motif-containing protein 8-like [Erythranthe guttata]|eukprot:XP_012854373.1 PREDICTED: QWRF motif-containing protein 8-like [Erythranthe guttata]
MLRSQTREVSSRGRSPSPSPAPVSKRCPSPNASTRTSNSTLSVPKRAVSTERKRPSTPVSTPVHDTTLASKKTPESFSLWPSTTRSLDASAPIGKREKHQPVSLSRSSTPEIDNFSSDVAENSRHLSRWPGRAAGAPSTVKASNNSKIDKITKTTPSLFNFRTAVAPSSCTRRLSFDGTSKPLQKSSTDLLKLISREEMFSGSSVDNDDDDFDATTTRRQSSPGSGAHGISASVSRRVSPSRGTSPATIRQSSPSRQPQNSSSVLVVAPSSCTRRLSLDGTSKPQQKSSTDLLKPISREEMFNGSSVDNDDDDFDATTTRRQSLPSSGAHGTSPSFSRRKTKTTPSLFNFRTAAAPSLCMRRLSLDGTSKPLLKSLTDLLKLISREEMLSRTSVDNDDDDNFDAARVRRQSLPCSGAHGTSPSISIRVSPSRGRSVTPSCSRGASPTRIIRPSSPSRQPQNSTFVPGFIADVKKGKKVENNAEDAHQLKQLYNRHLQWRYANARNIDALHSQKAKAEKIFYSVWRIILDLLDVVTKKRSDLKLLRLKLKIYSILDNQMNYLNKWASIERCHASSLTCIIEDLQSSTILVPVTGGATVDIKTVKSVVCSAVDVMMEIGSSLCSIIPQLVSFEDRFFFFRFRLCDN